MTTLYQAIYGEDVTIQTNNKKGLKKALKEFFGDNGEGYFELTYNDGNGNYILDLPFNYAKEVFNLIGGAE